VAFDLADFELRVLDHQSEWTALSVEVTVKQMSPNHGAAITTAEFASPEWLASVAARDTGELDLDAGRKADGWLVAKHYDLHSPAQVDEVLAELIALMRDATLPAAALASWLDRG
jgi:hypothetical protein